jgi:phosphatidylethanolamine-binding protein (PEBP) family uncharacterized protein
MDLTTSIRLDPVALRYTCYGADSPPPLKWRNVPRGTVELDVFVIYADHNENPLTAWAVAGLSPHVTHLSGDAVPAGAIVGRNSAGRIGYTVCPLKQRTEPYVIAVYALAHRIPVEPGFDGEKLRERVVHEATSEGLREMLYAGG